MTMREIMSISSVVGAGPLLLAIPISAAAGAVTFFSPCCLPLVPGYLAYVTGMSGSDGQRPPEAGSLQDAAAVTRPVTPGSVALAPGLATSQRVARGQTVIGAGLFVLGFSVLFSTYGGAFGLLGSALRTHQQIATQILGAGTILLGLLFAGAFDRFTISGRILKPSIRPHAGLAGAPLLGVMFGLGWTPCIGPTLQTVLNLGLTSGTAARGAFLAFIYSLGLGVPFLFMALAAQQATRVSAFARQHARLITRAGGGMLVAVGVFEVSGAWSAMIIWMQIHWVGSYVLPI